MYDFFRNLIVIVDRLYVSITVIIIIINIIRQAKNRSEIQLKQMYAVETCCRKMQIAITITRVLSLRKVI